MKSIYYIAICMLMQWHIGAQNLQVIPQWITRQVDTNDNTQVFSSIGSVASVSDEEDGVLITSFLLNVEEIEDTTGLATLTQKIGLRVYPNPTPDVINLSRANWDEPLLVTITDPTGKLIRTVDWEGGIMQLQLYVPSASRGYYLINVSDRQRSTQSTFKILKQ